MPASDRKSNWRLLGKPRSDLQRCQEVQSRNAQGPPTGVEGALRDHRRFPLPGSLIRTYGVTTEVLESYFIETIHGHFVHCRSIVSQGDIAERIEARSTGRS